MNSPRLTPVARVMNVPVDAVDTEASLRAIGEFVRIGRETDRTFQVTTVNVNFLINSRKDPELLRVLQDSDLSLADGAPILWMSRLSGTPVRERVSGADLVPAMVERSQTSGWRILLFGSSNGVAELAAARLAERFPAADVIGITGPSLVQAADTSNAVIVHIRSLKPDILCVAFGNPKQELWIERFRSALGVPVLIGVGGALDFVAGNTKRAPRSVQRLGLEWVYRTLHEPRRLLRRYARDAALFGPVFIGVLLDRCLASLGRKPFPAPLPPRDILRKRSSQASDGLAEEVFAR